MKSQKLTKEQAIAFSKAAKQAAKELGIRKPK
jgi:hypothetical protein